MKNASLTSMDGSMGNLSARLKKSLKTENRAENSCSFKEEDMNEHENYFQLINARLTKDPEVKYLPTQTAISNVVLAVDRGYGEKKKTFFPRVIFFGKDAENLEKYSAKGLRVNVYGHIETGSFESNGKTVYTTDLVVERVTFVDYKNKEPMPDFSEINGDIPF